MRYNDKENHNTNSYTSWRFQAHRNAETHAKNEERVSMKFWKVFKFVLYNLIYSNYGEYLAERRKVYHIRGFEVGIEETNVQELTNYSTLLQWTTPNYTP